MFTPFQAGGPVYSQDGRQAASSFLTVDQKTLPATERTAPGRLRFRENPRPCAYTSRTESTGRIEPVFQRR